jgi:MFS family permease
MLVAGLLVFSFFNSSDMFLLLKVKSSGISDTAMIGFYIFYNLVYALFSYPMGVLGDRLGMKKVLTCGLGLFAAVYFGFGFAESFSIFAGLFLFYGIYAASTEGISKALITNISVSTDTATAIGFYNSFASIATLLASITAGFIWTEFGSRVTFIFSGCGTALIIIYFIIAFSAGKK